MLYSPIEVTIGSIFSINIDLKELPIVINPKMVLIAQDKTNFITIDGVLISGKNYSFTMTSAQTKNASFETYDIFVFWEINENETPDTDDFDFKKFVQFKPSNVIDYA